MKFLPSALSAAGRPVLSGLSSPHEAARQIALLSRRKDTKNFSRLFLLALI